jgi:hypothetical protein
MIWFRDVSRSLFTVECLTKRTTGVNISVLAVLMYIACMLALNSGAKSVLHYLPDEQLPNDGG